MRSAKTWILILTVFLASEVAWASAVPAKCTMKAEADTECGNYKSGIAVPSECSEILSKGKSIECSGKAAKMKDSDARTALHLYMKDSDDFVDKGICSRNHNREAHGFYREQILRCDDYIKACNSVCTGGEKASCADLLKQREALVNLATDLKEKAALSYKAVESRADASEIGKIKKDRLHEWNKTCDVKSSVASRDRRKRTRRSEERERDEGDKRNPAATANNNNPGPTGSGGGGGGIGEALKTALPLALMALPFLMQNNEEPDDNTDGFAKFCAENPDSQACQSGEIDCKNEAVAQLNPDKCLCADPEIARVTPICNPQKVGEGSVGSLDVANLGGRGGLLGSNNLTDLLGSQSFNGGPVQGTDPAVEANQKGGGGGGPNASGGPAAKAGGGGGGGHGPGPYNTDVLKGVSKGGGGAAGAGGAGGYAYGGGSKGDDGSGGDPFNLKKYLPGDGGNRALAGMAIKSTDGLTGPFGPSIWEKISRRYKRMQPFLKR